MASRPAAKGACASPDLGGACDACSRDEIPVCTAAGTNVLNACVATECQAQTVAHAGWCADGPSCKAKGGRCALRRSGWFCADGERFDPADVTNDCSQGVFDDTCCVPTWTAPCTYLGVVSATLSVNPFTCVPSDVPVCVASPDNASCTRATTVGRSTGGGGVARLDTESTLVAGPNATVELSGKNGSGTTFHCTGVWSGDTDFSHGNTLTCQVCTGTSCSSCLILQHHACELP